MFKPRTDSIWKLQIAWHISKNLSTESFHVIFFNSLLLGRHPLCGVPFPRLTTTPTTPITRDNHSFSQPHQPFPLDDFLMAAHAYRRENHGTASYNVLCPLKQPMYAPSSHTSSWFPCLLHLDYSTPFCRLGLVSFLRLFNALGPLQLCC